VDLSLTLLSIPLSLGGVSLSDLESDVREATETANEFFDMPVYLYVLVSLSLSLSSI
jgi:hypothetical protein